ncbi:MAG: hypothetical protein QOG96_361 [Pseudonocardiales bacterium]|nr:hypothetical protein [Pseudonocardiales bacterium]
MSRTNTAELDLPGRLRDARRELTGRLGPGPAPDRVRRRLLWVGLFVTAAGAAIWAMLSRRPAELGPLSAPATPVPVANTTNGPRSEPLGRRALTASEWGFPALCSA